MKLKLDLDELAQDFFEDSRLMGIVAPMKDYRFSWLLNNKLRFDFRMKNDIEIQLTKKGRQYFFAVYEYRDPLGSLCHYLYNNQFDGEYLLPEFRHLDFSHTTRNPMLLLLISGLRLSRQAQRA